MIPTRLTPPSGRRTAHRGRAHATADPVADFYKGKTLTVVVPLGPGGTYDLYGRLAATIMEKHLPGNPKVVTQLMTGAGGALATNYMAFAPEDGTVLVTLHGSAPQNQLLETTGITTTSTSS